MWLAQPEAAAQRYATAVATPGDPLFRHYLSPARYAARFGAQQGAQAFGWNLGNVRPDIDDAEVADAFLARAGYEPIQGGVQAVLPHVDDFVAGHSLAAFAEVLELIANA